MNDWNKDGFLGLLGCAGLLGIIILVFVVGNQVIEQINTTNKPLKVTPQTATPVLTPMPTKVSEKDGMTLIYIPGGEFINGSDNGTKAERPVHRVFLSAFWIDQTEVTVGMYARCVADGACSEPDSIASRTRPDYYKNPDYADYPVVYVDWYQAGGYCTWAGRRLPTEAEWEKAARGTDGRTYPWGEGIDCNLANYQAKEGYCVGDTTRVGSYPQGASPYGVLDMAGNVWEWVADWYDDKYYRNSPIMQPEGPKTGVSRVLRGGSLGDIDRLVRTTNRFGNVPGLAFVRVGFRCAMDEP